VWRNSENVAQRRCDHYDENMSTVSVLLIAPPGDNSFVWKIDDEREMFVLGWVQTSEERVPT